MNEEFEMACAAIVRDASLIAVAPGRLLAEQRALIEEARETLNDALAKADRATRPLAA